LLVSLLLVAAFSVFLAFRLQKAKSLANSLFTAELSNIPAILDEIEPYRRHVDGQLRQAAGQSEDVHAKLVSNLALVRWDDEATAALCQVALDCEPEAMLLVCDALISPGEEITESLWQVLEIDADHPERQFRAAQLLANIQPPVNGAEAERWMKRADFIQTRLVEACIVAPQSFDPLTRLLQPMSSVMVDSLASAVGEAERSADTVTKLNLLLRFLQPSPRELTRHCLGASQWQLPIVLAPLKESLDRDGSIADYLRDVMTESPKREDSPEEREKTSRRIATAGALMAQHGHSAEVWPWLRRQPLPATRAYLIHRLQQVGLPLEILVQRLAGEQDSGIRTALILSLGQYDLPDNASKSAQLSALVQSAYLNDPDPGVHAAVEWLLGRWDASLLADLRSANRPPPTAARWRVNETGHLMIRIDGRGDSRIERVFEISSREVTLGQFLKFRPEGEWRRTFTSDDEHPLGAASWNDAIAYCNYLSKAEGLESTYPLSQAEIEQGVRADGWLLDGNHLNRTGYRLPTEAEWEMACQAGAVTRTYFGDQADLVAEYAWIAPGEANLRSQRCGILKPNDFGLFDALGNVSEWCDDRKEDATTQRVLRGGNYRSFEWQVARNESSSMEMITKYNSIGFRIARTVPVREASGRGD
jgi:hypothetical protein